MSPAYLRALTRWRAQAWRVISDPSAALSQRQLAFRFLQQHGIA